MRKAAPLFFILTISVLRPAGAFSLDMTLDSWEKGTCPASMYVNIAEVSTPYGDGISVDTIGYPGAYQWNYDFFGHSSDVLVVPPSGTVQVSGWFKYTDITPHLDRKYMAVYLLRADLTGYLCSATCILNYTRGDLPDTWYNRTLTISGLAPGQEFMLAFGRSDLCDMDRRLEATWAAIEVASCRVLKVPGSFPTLGQALAVASSGDTIQVSEGVYNERIVVDKDYLRIIGEDSSTTIIDAGTASGSDAAIQITSRRVFFGGFTVRNCHDTYGISVRGENATITESILTNNAVGIGVLASNCTFTKNLVCNNTNGAWLQNSIENCTFYQNSFCDNAQHVFQEPPIHVAGSWDNGYAGNFWSNCTATDANGDGIGDTAHVINTYNVDRYPLMNPYLLGDVNHDGAVNMLDVWLVAKAYGSVPHTPRWNPHCDIDSNNIVNMLDLYKTATRYGQHNPQA